MTLLKITGIWVVVILTAWALTLAIVFPLGLGPEWAFLLGLLFGVPAGTVGFLLTVEVA